MGDKQVVHSALSYWVREPGVGEIRPAALAAPGPDEVLVRTLCSGISRGTETLVFTGGVPASQYAAMRAPYQEGDFPGPVKYGYLNVGVVEAGPPELLGRTVFCLYPHQTAYVVPAHAVVEIPDGVPPALCRRLNLFDRRTAFAQVHFPQAGEVFAHLLLSHWALNRILQVAGSLVVTVLLASLSWKYFESPILRLKERFGTAGGRPALIASAVEQLEPAVSEGLA